jgi:DNA polymerase
MKDAVNQLRFFSDLGVTHLKLAQPLEASEPSLPDVMAETEVGVEAEVEVETSHGSVETLVAIREDMGDCRRCKLCETRTNIVFGVGNPSADLMFIGEAPGADEDAQGIPFVGRAGQLLTRIIETMFDLKREDVYIANIIKCRPPGNRDPESDEIESCEGFLFRQIESIQPKVIVALGRCAAQTLLRTGTPISKLRGEFVDYRGRLLLPTFHPSYLLRNPSKKREVFVDMKAVRAKLEDLNPIQ